MKQKGFLWNRALNLKVCWKETFQFLLKVSNISRLGSGEDSFFIATEDDTYHMQVAKTRNTMLIAEPETGKIIQCIPIIS